MITNITRPHRRNTLIRTTAFAMTLALGAALTISADQSADGVKDARAALEKWVETQRIISKENREWALGREMLNERIAMVNREIDSLKTKIAETEAGIGEADGKREELVKENETLKSGAASLADTVIALEVGVKALLPRVPDPIRQRVLPLSQRIVAADEETKLSLAERYQNVVGILNELNKFHREITVTSEVRTLPDGTSAEVTTMYVGVSRGYYVGGNGTIAGTGTSGPDSWVWTPANQLAANITKAIAILKNEEVASFVRLPADIVD